MFVHAKDFVCPLFWRRYKIELNINVININFYISNTRKKVVVYVLKYYIVAQLFMILVIHVSTMAITRNMLHAS